MMKKLTWFHILIALVLTKLVLHIFVNGQWSFHRDELLYLALGRHLDWGYASVPPSIGFWGWFGTTILGGSVEGVRLISTIIGTSTVVLTALMAREMQPASEEGEKRSGLFAMILIGLSGLLCGAFLRPCMLFMPVVFDMFYWTLLSWLFLKYINTQKKSWLLWFGAMVGFGLLNKYTILIFLFAMLPGLLFTKHRKIFSERNLYLATGIALLIFLPNIIWQAQHQFPVFRHMTELAATQFVHVSLDSFFMDQMRFYMPAIPIWLCGLYFLLFHKEAKPWRIFGWMYLMVLLVLLMFSAKSYYSLGAYPVLIAAGAAYIEQVTTQGRRWIRWVVLAWMVGLGILSLPAALPLYPPEKEAEFVRNFSKIPGLEGILRWEDGNYYALPQDFADMMGWQEIADVVGKTWESIPDKSTAAIYADSYGMAGSIEHLGRKYNVPAVFCFSDTYRYWLPDSISANFQTLIYVNDELGDDMPSFFEQIEKVWELNMPLSRQHGVLVYLCKKPTPAFFERIGGAIRQAKNEEEID